MRGNPFIQRLVRADLVALAFSGFTAAFGLVTIALAFSGCQTVFVLAYAGLTVLFAGCSLFILRSAGEGFITQPAPRAAAEPELW